MSFGCLVRLRVNLADRLTDWTHHLDSYLAGDPEPTSLDDSRTELPDESGVYSHRMHAVSPRDA